MFDFKKAVDDSSLGEASKAEAKKLLAGDTPTS
jgi:hypothetical protein